MSPTIEYDGATKPLEPEDGQQALTPVFERVPPSSLDMAADVRLWWMTPGFAVRVEPTAVGMTASLVFRNQPTDLPGLCVEADGLSVPQGPWIAHQELRAWMEGKEPAFDRRDTGAGYLTARVI